MLRNHCANHRHRLRSQFSIRMCLPRSMARQTRLVALPATRYFTAPLVNSSFSHPSPMHNSWGLRKRLCLLLVSALLLSGFGLAAWIQPDPRGFGSHQQLHLPPCTFQSQFHLPCPACGMTTSFAHFVRGHWLQALRSSTTAFVLAIECLLALMWCLISVWRQQSWLLVRLDLAVAWSVFCLYLVGLTEWVVRILSQSSI